MITGQVPTNIQALILHLFGVYGKIIPQQLCTKYASIEDMTYDVKESINKALNDVEELMEVVKISVIPYSSTQVVDLVYISIAKHQFFVMTLGLGSGARNKRGLG